METDSRKVSFLPQGYLSHLWQCRVVNQSHLALKSTSSFLISPSIPNDSIIVLNELRDTQVFDNDNDISLLYGFECREITFVLPKLCRRKSRSIFTCLIYLHVDHFCFFSRFVQSDLVHHEFSIFYYFFLGHQCRPQKRQGTEIDLERQYNR